MPKSTMPESTTEPKRVDPPALEASLASLDRRLTGTVPLKAGSILLRFTDTGEQHSIDGAGHNLRLVGSAASEPLLEISGPSAVLTAIIDGRKEASRAFAVGKIQVRGDLPYLEALLKDMCLLECGE